MRQILLLSLMLFLHYFSSAKRHRLMQKGGTLLKEPHSVKDRPGTPKANLLRAGAGTIFRTIASQHVRFSTATGLRLIG